MNFDQIDDFNLAQEVDYDEIQAKIYDSMMEEEYNEELAKIREEIKQQYQDGQYDRDVSEFDEEVEQAIDKRLEKLKDSKNEFVIEEEAEMWASIRDETNLRPPKDIEYEDPFADYDDELGLNLEGEDDLECY